MNKKFKEIAKFFENKKRVILMQFKNELTEEEKKVSLEKEVEIIDGIIEAIENLEENSDNPVIDELKQKVEDLKTVLDENQEDFENKIKDLTKEMDKKTFAHFVKNAVEEKLFQNAKGGERVARMHFENASNNANLAVIYSDIDIGVAPSRVPTLIDHVRPIALNGENAVAWNEVVGDETKDKAAIVVIGNDKPVRTPGHSTTTTGTKTIAVISQLARQYQAAVSLIADIYLNDNRKDVLRKLNSQIIYLLAEGNDVADYTTDLPEVDKAQLVDVIRFVADLIREKHEDERVVVGLTRSTLFALDSVKDENGNYINYNFAEKGIVLVQVPTVQETVEQKTTTIFGDDNILAFAENTIRWYNDGIENRVSEHRYWEENQIGLMTEVLNSLFVLRGTDANATVFDDWTTILEDITPEEVTG